MSLGTAELLALLPYLVLTAACAGLLLLIGFCRHHGLTAGLTVLALLAALAALIPAARAAPRPVTPLLVVDGYTLFFVGLVLSAALVVAVLAYHYFQSARRESQREEIYVLLLAATLGAAVLAGSRHFASFFLGLETLSIALFAMIPYTLAQRASRPLEAGLKYLVLSGVSSAFLLFGMALIYAELGTLVFPHMAPALTGQAGPYVTGGLALLIAGVGFKLSVVPFHLWTPDVYQGAPAPVTAFLATVSKGAVFALLLRYFLEAGAHAQGALLLALSLVAIASMLIGNLLALLQDNLKRLLAYSSIAHLGYLLVAFLAGGPFAVEAVGYYLAAYFIMTLGAFGLVSLRSRAAEPEDREALADYRGLFWQRPWQAAALSAMLLSLAGIPLTVGFIGKFYLFAAGLQAALWWPLAALVIGSVIGLYYYLRVVVAMYLPQPPEAPQAPPLPLPGGLVLAALSVLLLWWGVFPGALIGIVQRTSLAFG